uniref:Tyrosine specific protein phosphatases domain-containing protein n=1 Tax=Thermomicrobium roseum TaxID=500 RepID=A0A7C5RUB2_THERO
MACRHDAAYTIFEDRGRQLRAANQRGLQDALKRADCLVDLAGLTDDEHSLRFILPGSHPRFTPLHEVLGPPMLLRLDWEDMGVPPVGLAFWEKLWELLPEGVTVFACAGGHGRTGTALAAMLIARGMSVEEAIEYVRRKHCPHAIETRGQEEYLRSLR